MKADFEKQILNILKILRNAEVSCQFRLVSFIDG